MTSIIAVAPSLVTPGPLNRSPHRIDAGCCDQRLFLSWRTDDLCRLLASADIHDGPDHNTLQSETGYINASALAILAAARLFRIDASASDRFCGN